MRRGAIAVVVAALALTGCFDYSRGTRSGTVVKFSLKGVLCKTWEGTMLLGGAQTAAAGLTWDFTVDPYAKHGERIGDLVAALRAAQEAGEPVTIEYQQEAVTSPCRAKTDYFVQSVRRR